MIMEGEGRYQKQMYSSAATASSRQQRWNFHIVHYVSDDFSSGHYAMIQPRENNGTHEFSVDDVEAVD